MIRIDRQRTAADLLPAINRLFDLSAQKIRSIEDCVALRKTDRRCSPSMACIDRAAGRSGRRDFSSARRCCSSMRRAIANFSSSAARARSSAWLPHLTHVGVHDHGFNNVSTYGNLWRLAREGKFEAEPWEMRFYALALKVTGAVQARRWTPIPGGGFIYSFNGAHSLFVDTIRTLRALALSHVLGHRLLEEQDVQVNLLERLLQHARATADVQRVLRQGARHVRRARPDGARELVQCRKRDVSRPELAAGLLAVLNMDARPRVGDAGVCGTAGVPRDDRFRRTRSSKTKKWTLTPFMRRRWRRVISISIMRRLPTAFHTGIPVRRDSRRSATGDRVPAESVQRSRARRQLGSRDRGAGAAPARARGRGSRRQTASRYEQAGLRVLETLIDEAGPYLSRDAAASGAAPAFGLSPAERMGSRARRLAHSARRVEHVGRLPPARGRALRQAHRRRRAVSDVFRLRTCTEQRSYNHVERPKAARYRWRGWAPRQLKR